MCNHETELVERCNAWWPLGQGRQNEPDVHPLETEGAKVLLRASWLGDLDPHQLLQPHGPLVLSTNHHFAQSRTNEQGDHYTQCPPFRIIEEGGSLGILETAISLSIATLTCNCLNMNSVARLPRALVLE
jgi:hypothetical protein